MFYVISRGRARTLSATSCRGVCFSLFVIVLILVLVLSTLGFKHNLNLTERLFCI